jgi:hypothetical protein
MEWQRGWRRRGRDFGVGSSETSFSVRGDEERIVRFLPPVVIRHVI